MAAFLRIPIDLFTCRGSRETQSELGASQGEVCNGGQDSGAAGRCVYVCRCGTAEGSEPGTGTSQCDRAGYVGRPRVGYRKKGTHESPDPLPPGVGGRLAIG